MPKISIITVNYNGVDGLRQTLYSVAEQVFDGVPPIEHIIVDGGSIDGSVDFIREYAEINAHKYPIKWISERDRGIYDGMNKAVMMANGEYLYFLNGGDKLAHTHSLKDAADLLDDSDIIVGRVNYILDGKKVGESKLIAESDLNLYSMYLEGICHQAAIIKKSLLQKFPYDVNARINADWKFFVETIVMNNASVKLAPLFIADFDKGGLSSNLQALLTERAALLDTIVPVRIARDYKSIAPHYYEVKRVKWLLRHKCWYKLYRGISTLGIKMLGND